MEILNCKKDDLELEIQDLENGTVYLHLAGNLTGDNIEQLNFWADKVRETLHSTKEKYGTVLCLINLEKGLEADMKSLTSLIGLMQYNKAYVTKTAVFGANMVMKDFIRIASRVAKRTNLHTFDTKEEAEKWLYE